MDQTSQIEDSGDPSRIGAIPSSINAMWFAGDYRVQPSRTRMHILAVAESRNSFENVSVYHEMEDACGYVTTNGNCVELKQKIEIRAL